MQVVKIISNHKLSSFVIGTLLIQLVVLISAFFFVSGQVSATGNKTLVASVDESKDAPSAGEVSEEVIADKASVPVEAALPAEPETPVAEPESIVLEEKLSAPFRYLVQPGETLTHIWKNNGGTYAGALLAAEAFESVGVPLHAIRGGEEVEIRNADDGDIHVFTKKLPEGKTLVLSGNSKEGYEAELVTPRVFEEEKKISGIIYNNFASAAVDSSVPYEIVDELVDLFGSRVEFCRDIQQGDRFTVIYKERRGIDGELFSTSPVVAATLTNRGKPMAAVRYVNSDKKARYYDDKGNLLGNYFLRYPLRFTRISSTFSDSRFHPVLRRRRPHNGVDFAAPTGTAVRSVADGVVVKAGWAGASGKMIKIKHSDRWSTAYLHLSRINSGMRSGTRVERGQVIGKVGSTGLSTGPHLHFSLYDRGRYVNALKVDLPKMPSEFEQIPVSFLQNVLARLEDAADEHQIA